MSDEDKRLQMQRDELNRQMQRDELNRQEAQRILDADLRKKEAANRCANNDGPGVMGGLCVGCYAAMRAEEARANGGLFQKEMVTAIIKDLDGAEDARMGPKAENSVVRLEPIVNRMTQSPQGSKPDATYARAYAQNLDKTPQLQRLWERAKSDAEESARKRGVVADFASARAQLWELVNADPSNDAQFVRRMLDAAGFVIGHGDRAPMLAVEWRDRKSGRYDNARRLSLDHEVPQSKDRSKSMDGANLRFMLMDDNLRRGARYGNAEMPYNHAAAEFRRQNEAIRAVEAERRNRELANRCVNNDGLAIMGGLCIACYATMRADEAKVKGDMLQGRVFELIARWADWAK